MGTVFLEKIHPTETVRLTITAIHQILKQAFVRVKKLNISTRCTNFLYNVTFMRILSLTSFLYCIINLMLYIYVSRRVDRSSKDDLGRGCSAQL